MGILENKTKQSTRRTKLQEAILLILASGGRIGGDSLVKQAIDYLFETELSTTPPRKSEIVRSTASRLSQKGLVRFENDRYAITKNGKEILDVWQKSRYVIKQPRKWDKKWRVIIFDIPEKKKKIRDHVREILLSAGFQRLQNSVWVYPYDCEDVIGLMKVDLGIGKYLLYMIVDQIENDRFLRMDFDLIK